MKKSTKIFIDFRLRFLVSFFVLLSFFGCSGCHSKTAKLPPRNDQQAVVLLHGLDNTDGLNDLEQQLKKQFPKVAIINLVRKNSKSIGIQQQAKEAFTALKSKNITDCELVLIGDSQGGLVAFSLYDQYKNQLNTKGIITHHTPWEGAPVAETTAVNIDQFLNNLLGNNPLFKFPKVRGNISDQLQAMLQNYTKGQGSTDLKPNSLFLRGIKASLAKTQIPILAIAGHKINLQAVVKKIFPSLGGTKINLSGLDEHWATLIQSPTQEDHDFLIPLSSQLAQNLPKSVNFVSEKIATHDHYVLLTEEKVYGLITKKIQQYLSTKKANNKT